MKQVNSERLIRRLRKIISHPARVVPLAFLAAILVGTVALMLPVSRAGPDAAPFLTALFTATSAVCVTGLVVVDTPTYWSPFGQALILMMFQVGGFGIMTGATLLGLLVSRRLHLSRRLIAQAETHSLQLGDVTGLVKLVLATTLSVELATAAFLSLRLHFGHGAPWGDAVWSGVFHAVSAFNNAGFSIYSDSLTGFARDPLFLGPVMLAVIVGGIGFPVLYELRRELTQPIHWSVHTKITLFGTALLLAVGTGVVLAYEWSNPVTLGALSLPDRLLSSLFHSTVSRTAGFNALDVGEMRTETLIVTDFLMLVGGGSAGTAGGIKVTTFLLLGFIVWTELRGEPDVTAFRRRISSDVQREALTVVLLALGLVSLATLALLSLTDFSLQAVVFEVISAFATVGLSTGITADLPPMGQLVIVALMYIGRVGTIAVGTALALRSRQRPFRYPEERPIVG